MKVNPINADKNSIFFYTLALLHNNDSFHMQQHNCKQLFKQTNQILCNINIPCTVLDINLGNMELYNLVIHPYIDATCKKFYKTQCVIIATN